MRFSNLDFHLNQLLAIETSAEPASIALQTQLNEITTLSFPNENSVNTSLFPQLEQLEPSFESIGAIIVGIGPGSYSGARVGLACAQALALTYGCPVVGLPSTAGIAEHLSEPIAAVVGDARRGAFFFIEQKLGTPASLPEILNQEEFVERIQQFPTKGVLSTFEETDRLPKKAVESRPIVKRCSTANGLINYWNSLSESAKQTYLNQVPEVQYLRPPNITKAKSPF